MIPQKPRIGFVGLGEVGYHIAKGLNGEGIEEITAYNNGARHKPPYSEAFRRRAKGIRVELVPTLAELAEKSDIVFSTVIPRAARQVAEEIAPFLKPPMIYADLNSCSPMVKEEMCLVVQAKGARFVGGVILGAPLYQGLKTLIYISGEGAEELGATMASYGMNLQVIPGKAGAAGMVKMLRSILTKGIPALLWESLLGAYKAGIDIKVFESALQAATETDLAAYSNRVISRVAIHAERRIGEMEDSAETLRHLGIKPIMTSAISQHLAWLARFRLKEHFGGEFPPDYKSVIRAIEQLQAKEG